MRPPQSVASERARQSFRLRAVPALGSLLVGCVVLLFAAWFLRATPLQTRATFSLGGVGDPITENFHPAETTDTGRGFRWTDGDGKLHLLPQGLGSHTLQLTLNAPRPDMLKGSVPVTITVNDQINLAVRQGDQQRRYSLLVPADRLSLADNVVELQSPTFRPEEVNRNERELGIAVFEVDWHGLSRSRWLLPTQVCLIALATALLYRLLVTQGIRGWPRLLAIALFVAITLAMRHSDTRFFYRWHALWATAATVLLLAVALALLPRREPSERLSLPEWVRQHWLAFVGYVGLTGVLLNQIVLGLTTHIFGASGDNYEYVWKMKWYADALIRHVSPVFAPQLFYPAGAELTISELAPAHHLLAVPLTWLFGPIVSYNLVMIASFLLTAFFTYLLARRLGANGGAAWVGGIVFAFCMRRFYHANGHFGMMGSEWLPLTLYGWEGLLTRRRVWDGYVAGIGYTLATWSTLIYGTTFPLFVIIYTVIRVGPRHLRDLWRSWQPIALMGLLSIALIVPLILPYVESFQQGTTYQHLYTQLVLHAARPVDYLLPSPFHPLWGAWASRFYLNNGGEEYVALAYTATILAFIGIWIGRRRRVVRALGVLLVINVVMSLGPELRLSATTALPLPAKLAYDYVPIFGNIRTWGRMSMYVALCAALLVGVALTAAPRRWYQPALIVAGVLIVFESISVLPLTAPRARAVDLWVGQQPGSGAVVYLPPDVERGREYNTLLFSDKPTSDGSGKFLPAHYREARNIYFRFPDLSSIRLLQRWQVDYVIVDEAALSKLKPDWRTTVATLPLLTPVYQRDGFSVYHVQR